MLQDCSREIKAVKEIFTKRKVVPTQPSPTIIIICVIHKRMAQLLDLNMFHMWSLYIRMNEIGFCFDNFIFKCNCNIKYKYIVLKKRTQATILN